MLLAIDGLDRALEAPEQALGADQRRLEVDGVAQLVDVLEHLVEVPEVRQDGVAVRLEDGAGDEQVEVAREVVGPETLPQAQHVGPGELALVPDEQHAEEEEEVGRVGGLQVQVELRVEELHELVEGGELGAHAGLVAEEIGLLRACQ